jgi:hypothetical protein
VMSGHSAPDQAVNTPSWMELVFHPPFILASTLVSLVTKMMVELSQFDSSCWSIICNRPQVLRSLPGLPT